MASNCNFTQLEKLYNIYFGICICIPHCIVHCKTSNSKYMLFSCNSAETVYSRKICHVLNYTLYSCMQ